MDMSTCLVLSTSVATGFRVLSRRASASIAERQVQPPEACDTFLSCCLQPTLLFIEFLSLLLQQFTTLLDVPHPHRDILDFGPLMGNFFSERTYQMLDCCIVRSWTLGPMR